MLKLDKRYTYGVIIVFVTFGLILGFFINTAGVIENLITNRVLTSELYQTWLHIKAQSAAFFISRNSTSEGKELCKNIHLFHDRMDQFISLSMFPQLQKVYPEIDQDLTWLEDNWANLWDKLDRIRFLIENFPHSTFESADSLIYSAPHNM
ncbi:unnamed protein product, partial [marine sediment metagenome]